MSQQQWLGEITFVYMIISIPRLLASCPVCFVVVSGRVWIIGDSIVRWAGDSNNQFTGAQVSWLGVGGAKIGGIPPRINRLLLGRTCPHTIVIHIGTNDVLNVAKRDLFTAVADTLKFLRQRLPHALIVWSAILPRLFWFGERTPKRGCRVRCAVNRHAASICSDLPVNNRVIYHPAFASKPHTLYRYDGVHLSALGNQIFRDQIKQGISYFQSHSKEQAPVFPPT